MAKRNIFDEKVEIKSNQLLPINYQIKSMADLLYDIGISPNKADGSPEPKWHKYLRFFFIVAFAIYTIKSLVCLLMPSEEKYLLMVIGDFLYTIPKSRHYWHLFHVIAVAMCTSLYIFMHFKTLPMGIYKMLSGLITPQQVGLYDQEYIEKFVKKAKAVFLFKNVVYRTIFVFFTLGIFLMIFSKYSLYDFFIYGIFYAIYWLLIALLSSNMFFIHGIYFNLLCYYFKLNLLIIQKKLKSQQLNNQTFADTLLKLDSIIVQIIKYDQKYWRMFNIQTLVCLYPIAGIVMYQFIIFNKELYSFYFLFIWFDVVSMILLLYLPATDLHSAIKQTSSLLYSQQARRKNLSLKNKIRLYSLILKTSSFESEFKSSSFDIGFYCGPFLLNNKFTIRLIINSVTYTILLFQMNYT